MSRPFVLFGKVYRWVDGQLTRIPDDEARCWEMLDREGEVFRCHRVVEHAGPHRADKATGVKL